MVFVNGEDVVHGEQDIHIFLLLLVLDQFGLVFPQKKALLQLGEQIVAQGFHEPIERLLVDEFMLHCLHDSLLLGKSEQGLDGKQFLAQDLRVDLQDGLGGLFEDSVGIEGGVETGEEGFEDVNEGFEAGFFSLPQLLVEVDEQSAVALDLF